ncbi:MAG: alpha/beta hydrolase [Pseudomonadota bacterium]
MAPGFQPRLEARFQSQRLDLSYVEWGEPDAYPVFLVHGGRDQKRSWDWVARALVDAGFRVIAHDLRGHGTSEQVSDGDYGVMEHVYDFASLVDHIGVDEFHLLGHSLGGNITLRYTGLFPDRVTKLISIEGLGPSPKMIAERKAQRIDDRLRQWIEQRRSMSDRTPRQMPSFEVALERMVSAHPYLTAEQAEHLTRFGLRETPEGYVEWAYDPAGMGRSPSDISQEDFEHLWRQITCPTWLVYGGDSWASDPSKDGRAAHFQNAEVTVIDGAGHWLHHDHFDEFTKGLLAFLAD